MKKAIGLNTDFDWRTDYVIQTKKYLCIKKYNKRIKKGRVYNVTNTIIEFERENSSDKVKMPVKLVLGGMYDNAVPLSEEEFIIYFKEEE